MNIKEKLVLPATLILALAAMPGLPQPTVSLRVVASTVEFEHPDGVFTQELRPHGITQRDTGHLAPDAIE